MVQLSCSVLWISRHFRKLEGVIGFLQPWRGSQPMVAMDVAISQGREHSSEMAYLRGRTMGMIWSYRLRRLWWSVIKGQTDRFTTGLSEGVWKIGQSGLWMDTKSNDRHIHGWTETWNFWSYTLVQTKDSEGSHQSSMNERGTTTTTNDGTPALPSPTKAVTAPFKRLAWDEMQRWRTQGLCFNCNERFTVGHKCQGPQLLLMENYGELDGEECEEIVDKDGKTLTSYGTSFSTWTLRTRFLLMGRVLTR